MTFFQKLALFSLRVSLGWMMFYAGITKVLNPEWSPFGYLARAKTFPDFYALFLDPTILPYTTFFNAWGLTLIGVALLVGFGVRTASIFAILIMLLYYFPALAFPYIGENAFLVDSHIIYATGFLVLLALGAKHPWSVAAFLKRLPFFATRPRLQKIIE